MTKFKSTFLVVCFLLTSNAKICKEGFVRLRYWCFYFHLEPTSLLKSRQICHKMGGHLVKIDSEMKEDTITKYLEDNGYRNSSATYELVRHSKDWIVNAWTERRKFCKDYEENYKRKHTRHFHIPNGEIPLASRARDRANFTTPPGFSIKLSLNPNAGMGAWADIAVPKYTVLGDYEGEEHTDPTLPVDYSWEIRSCDGKLDYLIDAGDPSKSNWVRWVNMARNADEENVFPIVCAGLVFYMTMEDILPNTELMVHYGYSYARRYGIYRKHPAWDFDFENNFYIRIGMVRVSYDDLYEFEDGTPVTYTNWELGEDERELPDDFGLFLKFNGKQWKWTAEGNYTYFTGSEGLKVPFICEE